MNESLDVKVQHLTAVYDAVFAMGAHAHQTFEASMKLPTYLRDQMAMRLVQHLKEQAKNLPK